MDNRISSYADSVVSSLPVSEELKDNLRDDLIQRISEACKDASVDAALEKLGNPKILAGEISKEMSLNSAPGEKHHHHHHKPKKYLGQYTCEESEYNIKLLYIPLIQITAGTERIVKPLFFEEDEGYEYY